MLLSSGQSLRFHIRRTSG
ncbi:unnamed protein product [Oppiella nova]|uniref:Uncharacterized protein n=1 Tax=Oppiella nova TaxID=334625 RepID=A0A7R9R1C9_9ACAR|nr:unnamed protein product [Oppiella nova]CAG2183434.1 unnamed protein product [Oppiella nova]